MSPACVLIFCSMILESEMNAVPKSRHSVCVEVVTESVKQEVDPVLSASVAWRESAFIRDAMSSAGAVGPMQVIPRFWCKKQPCDYIESGVRALKYYTLRHGERHGLCAYFSGKRCPVSQGVSHSYRDKVLKTYSKFSSYLSYSCGQDGC